MCWLTGLLTAMPARSDLFGVHAQLKGCVSQAAAKRGAGVLMFEPLGAPQYLCAASGVENIEVFSCGVAWQVLCSQARAPLT